MVEQAAVADIVQTLHQEVRGVAIQGLEEEVAAVLVLLMEENINQVEMVERAILK